MKNQRIRTTDHLVIGTGIAGLQLALYLQRHGNVTVVSKSDIIDNNTWYAQGGIASVLNSDDSFDQHVEDTLQAGVLLSQAADVLARLAVCQCDILTIKTCIITW